MHGLWRAWSRETPGRQRHHYRMVRGQVHEHGQNVELLKEKQRLNSCPVSWPRKYATSRVFCDEAGSPTFRNHSFERFLHSLANDFRTRAIVHGDDFDALLRTTAALTDHFLHRTVGGRENHDHAL